MVRLTTVLIFWLGGTFRLSSLTEVGNQRMKFRVAALAGVYEAGLFVGKELCRTGAVEVSGGVSLSHWLTNKLYRHRERLHKTWQ